MRTGEQPLIEALAPERIAGLYGRPDSWTARLVLRHRKRAQKGGEQQGDSGGLTPKTWIVTYSAALLVIMFVWTTISGVLLGSGGVTWLSSSIPAPTPGERLVIGLPFLYDPVALIVLATLILTPYFCASQVSAIASFNAMNESNIAYRAADLNVDKLNDLIRKINKAFSIVGMRSVSLLILLGSIVGSHQLNGVVQSNGIFENWNRTDLPASTWRTGVYEGWWANTHHHREFALALVVAGAFLFYIVVKQLAMGVIFAVYGRRALKLGFGVAPNLTLNTDGYHGLRRLRYFMQYTYAVTIVDLIAVLGVAAVWLPWYELGVFAVAIVMIAGVSTVLYPTTIAIGGSVLEKRKYVEWLSKRDDLTVEQRTELVERVWALPHLPFRLRSTLSFTTLYFLIPVILLVLSALLS